MINTKETISIISSYFEPYLKLLSISNEEYYFRKESTSLRDVNNEKRFFHPKIEHEFLKDRLSVKEGILYVALPINADIDNLKESDLLYVGCCKNGDARFWRGKKANKTKFEVPRSCFHHEPMRRGRNGNSLESHLRYRGSVCIYTMTNKTVKEITASLNIQLPYGYYPAHQLEKKILSDGYTKWMWNKRA